MNNNLMSILCKRKSRGLRSYDYDLVLRANEGTDNIYDTIWNLLLSKADENLLSDKISITLYFLNTNQLMNDERFNELTWNGIDSDPGLADCFNARNAYEQIVFIYLDEDAHGRTPVLLNTLCSLLKEDGINIEMDAVSHKFTCSIERKQLKSLQDAAFILNLRKRDY